MSNGFRALILAILLVGLVPAEAVAESSFDQIARHDELTEQHARVFRLYQAYFDRSPDPTGAVYWVAETDRCASLAAISDAFAASDEFAARYRGQTGRAFIGQIYRNVLGRAGDPDGVTYWTDLLERGVLTKGGVVLNISLSPEFSRRYPFPSDGVPDRHCHRPDGRATGRSVHHLANDPLVTVAGLTLAAPSTVIERAGFHQSTHPGALPMTAVLPSPVRVTTMASRNRGTHRHGALDIVADPSTAITAPVTGTVARAGHYTLYCRYRDGFVVINPDQRPDLEVKVLHVQDVAVVAGQRVEVGDPIAASPTTFPFGSQIDDLSAEPSWPHVHLEVVDPSIPRKPSSGGGC